MRLKKTLFSAAAFAMLGASASVLAPGKAEALPAFARQTGAACLSCHFQTFPSLKAFGRSFMMNSFTDVGDQALVEDDNLSIPSVLNATFEVRGNVTNTSVSGNTLPSATTYTIPDAARLFVAGRIGSNTGAFIAFMPNMPAPMGPTPVWMLLNSWDVGDFKVGFGAHKSPWGGSNVMEVSNVFGHRGDKLAGQDVSAISASGFTQMTTGIGGWVGNDMGYLQFSLIAPSLATTGATNVGLKMGKLVRGVATIDLAGWDTLIGFGIVGGKAGKPVAGDNGAGAAEIPMDLQFIDVQLQGEVGDATVGVYADWAHAKGKTGATGSGNYYGRQGGFMNMAAPANVTGNKYDGYSIRAEVGPTTNFLVGIGYGRQKYSNANPANSTTVNHYQLAATYKVYQNFDINLVYSNEKETTGGASATTRSLKLEVDALM